MTDSGRDQWEQQEQTRAAATNRVVDSNAACRLVVAGPGSGKSFTFRRALERAVVDPEAARGLVLTFIRNLVADLEDDLGDLASVFTFHGYCKYLMHQHDVAGLRDGDYYPPLIELIAEDIAIVGQGPVSIKEIDEHLHNLDEDDGLNSLVLEIGDYYCAVSHTDAVYRVFRHFDEQRDSIPEYPLVVVDEYQDFSRLETGFIGLLGEKSPVLIAGDDDQALYVQLKHARPELIRELARGGDAELFELPFCSRCTTVVVAAVNDVIARAIEEGFLGDRLAKPFECYLPDKEADSTENPQLIHVSCSTEQQRYAGRYIAQQISNIPAEDIQRSREKGYPTALVIGPNPFLSRAYDIVREAHPGAKMKKGVVVPLDALDGYYRIARNPCSRLGWRVLVATNPTSSCETAVKRALEHEEELVDLLPPEYVARHREVARVVGLLVNDGALTEDESALLLDATGRSIADAREYLHLADDHEGPAFDEVAVDTEVAVEEEPDILFTSFEGAKGLSAEHVFIVGMNEPHFPRKGAVSDHDICAFIVALSRTRKRCHLISHGFFATSYMPESVFLRWVEPHLSTIRVDKDYDFSSAPDCGG